MPRSYRPPWEEHRWRQTAPRWTCRNCRRGCVISFHRTCRSARWWMPCMARSCLWNWTSVSSGSASIFLMRGSPSGACRNVSADSLPPGANCPATICFGRRTVSGRGSCWRRTPIPKESLLRRWLRWESRKNTGSAISPGNWPVCMDGPASSAGDPVHPAITGPSVIRPTWSITSRCACRCHWRCCTNVECSLFRAVSPRCTTR